MNLATYISLIAIGTLFTYYYHFFARKSRPLVITRIPFAILVSSTFVVTGSMALNTTLTILVALILFSIVSLQDLWIVYGLSLDNTKEALQKTCRVTRTEFHTENNTFVLKNNLKIKTLKIIQNLTFYSFKNKEKSKHAKLIKKVFHKFILNFTI